MNIPNTTITKNKYGYDIAPIEGYVLHNSNRDVYDIDIETGEETFARGYSTSSSGVGLNYDFETTKDIDGYTAYGRFEIFARPIEEAEGNVF